MPIVDKYRDMGTMIMGKSEAGLVRLGDYLQVSSSGDPAAVAGLQLFSQAVSAPSVTCSHVTGGS